jgi:alpha galactosidase C-like protein
VGAHSKGQQQSRPHKKPVSLRRKIVRAVVVVLVILTGLIVLGNLLPAHKAATPPLGQPQHIVTAYSVNVSPAGILPPLVAAHSHVTAIVKTGSDGTKSLVLANTGTGRASAVFTLAELGIHKPVVTIHNIWTGKTAVAGAVRVVLAPGGTNLYSLK